MPKTNVEKLTETRSKLTVSLKYADLEPFLKQAYATISQQVSIPGFRKGHVPPPIIDQRLGRQAVVEQAVNESLDSFYQQALVETETEPMGRPSADVEKWLDVADPKSELVLAFEVEVRPDFTLPKYNGLKIEVDAVDVDKDAVEAELTKLRERFGELKTVNKPATEGLFVELDLVAQIDGQQVDQATGVSYEVGSANMLEGLDEAIDTLTAGETTTFTSQLLGGEYEGQDAEVTVTITAVKKRELAKADDDFAQLASEFDTLKELREDLKKQVSQGAVFAQGRQARDILVDRLIESAKIPMSEELIEDEVHRHLEGEGRLDDDVHRAEVRADSEKQYALRLLLDEIAKAENVTPTQNELSQYIMQSAQQYGMDPTQFIQAISQGGQINALAAEVTRNKALAVALSQAKVVDSNGKAVDLTDFTAIDTSEDEGAEAAAKPAAKKPAAKKPAVKAEDEKPAAKKPAAKKQAAKAADKPADKKPAAKKPAAKKPAAKKPAAK